LEAEGVDVTPLPGEPDEGGEGGGRISWAEVGWFPQAVEVEVPEDDAE